MVFLPPRHGKSEFISKYFAAWYLGTFPDRRVILTSYEADFAAQWGRRARELIEEHGTLSFVEKVEVMPDSSSASRWDIKGHVGGMVTAGVGGPITGKGADLVIIDDPVKNAEQASSKTYKDKAWEWYQSTLYTRLEPNGAIILIQTRWNQADLAGKILTDSEQGGEKWEVVNLPAIAEENDQIGRVVGAPLWPERFGIPELEKIKRTVGSYYWTALYQQRPTPQEGGMFKRQWFPIIDAAPVGLAAYCRRWDLAASQNKGDYTAGLSLGKKDGRFYVLDLQRARESPAGVEALVKQTAQIDGYDYKVRMEQEPGSSGKNTIDHYARKVLEGYDFKGIPSTGPKEVRAQPVSAAAEAGNVILIKGHWNAEFLDEVSLFPNGDNDDIVDVLSGAFTDLTQEGDTANIPDEMASFGGISMDEDRKDRYGY
jgi:predicted phage terminase large subunit-like protein